MIGRGAIGNRIKKKLQKKMQPKEFYVKISSPEEYKKLVRQGVSLELADATREVMNLRKEIEKKEEYIQELLKKIRKEEDKEIKKQKKFLKKLKKANEFNIFFEPEKPIAIISSFTSEPFANENGERMPFWVGIRFVSTPEGTYVVPLLSKRPKIKDVIATLETSPRIYLYNFPSMFTDERLLVHKMKHGGVVEVNITPEGYFVPNGELKFTGDEGGEGE